MADRVSTYPLKLDIPEQDFYREFQSHSELVNWLGEQVKYWGQIVLNLNGVDFGSHTIDVNNARSQLQKRWQGWMNSVKEPEDPPHTTLDEIKHLAGNLQIMIHDGFLGQQIDRLNNEGRINEAAMAVPMFNENIVRVPGQTNTSFKNWEISG